MVTFHKPAASSAINWEDLLGLLLLIYPTKVEANVNTSVGVKDAIVADVHILDGPDPQVIEGAYIWPRVLQVQLRPFVGTGEPCLGRLVQGNAKAGQSPPWKLADATEDDEKAATAHLGEPPF
jgi:hypothetical protein